MRVINTICDEGIVNLCEAIVEQARTDWTDEKKVPLFDRATVEPFLDGELFKSISLSVFGERFDTETILSFWGPPYIANSHFREWLSSSPFRGSNTIGAFDMPIDEYRNWLDIDHPFYEQEYAIRECVKDNSQIGLAPLMIWRFIVDNKFSIKDFAEECRISQAYLRRILGGYNVCDRSLEKIAITMGTTVDKLVKGE